MTSYRDRHLAGEYQAPKPKATPKPKAKAKTKTTSGKRK